MEALPIVDDAELVEALRDVAGVHFDREDPSWKERSAECLRTVLEDRDLSEKLHDWWAAREPDVEPSGPLPKVVAFRAMAQGGQKDNLSENLPTGSIPDDYAQLPAPERLVGAVLLEQLIDARLKMAWGSFENRRLVPPSVLGFSDDDVKAPIAATRVAKILIEAQRRLERSFPRPRATLVERIQAFIFPHANWVVSCHRAAQNYMVVNSRHGESTMTLSSVASGTDLYILLVETGRPPYRDRVSLENETAGAEQLERVLGSRGTAARTAFDGWCDSFAQS